MAATKDRVTEVLAIVDGATNPESAEMLDDGETLVFGNCTLATGNPNMRGGKALVYLEGQAFISTARVTGRGAATVIERHLVRGLTATLGTEVHRRGTGRWPAGTALTACGGQPMVTVADGPLLGAESGRQQVYAFDPADGTPRGRIALWPGSAVAKALGHHVEMPNGLAVAPNGDIFVADNPNSNPVDWTPPPVPACVYRIPAEAIDGLLDDDPAAAGLVRAVPWEGWFNGCAASPDDGACWVVSCSSHDPAKGAIFRLDADDFEAGRLPDPFVRDLGVLDGVALTKRGTVFASNPRTNQLFAFTPDGSALLLTGADGPLPFSNTADINIVYPKFLDGEPALAVGDITIGQAPGAGRIVLLSVEGL
jgi:sugar lactone lactonase YvrE